MDSFKENAKILLAEAGQNAYVLTAWLFIIIAFVAAIAEPTAALLPLVLGGVFYGIARMGDDDSDSDQQAAG